MLKNFLKKRIYSGKKMESNIQFANEKIKKAFEKLEKEDSQMYKLISRAFEDIENDAFCGIQIPKHLIPKEYTQKFNIKNLWKYNLPDAWRLIYSIEGKNFKIISIVLEWLDHKEYERRFHY
jgi:Txe/YoeB family toxin of Txe-Axe toxin-antitoxin module